MSNQDISMNKDSYEKVRDITLQSMECFVFHLNRLNFVRMSTRRTTEPEEHLLQEIFICMRQLNELLTNEQEPI